jgi:fructose 1,6-bisphosphatase
MVTLSVSKADTGGYVGHCDVHPGMIAEARRRIADAVGDRLIGGQAATGGDDLSLIMSHEKRLVFDRPAEMHDLLMFVGAPARYGVHSLRSKTPGEQAAATSPQRLSLIAGKYVGKVSRRPAPS